MDTVVITRHPGLVEYLIELKVIEEGTEFTEHATPQMVRGKRVIGVLPLDLAAEAECVVSVPLKIPPELRGVELSADQVREFAGEVTTYKVEVIRGYRWVEPD